MSRIGKKPIEIPSGAKVDISDRTITVEGKLGKLTYEHRPEIKVELEDDGKTVICSRDSETREVRAYHGLTRSLIANMIEGVLNGYEKRLEIHGVGYLGRLRATRFSFAWGLPTKCTRRFHRAWTSPVPTRRTWSSKARISNKWVNSPPKCVPCESRSRTRARASATKANRSDVRRAKQERSEITVVR